ncbi:MAG: tetratricopeptide repeat protein [Planctomycetota bacterium]|jgi:tetratricopeptide (TPR) repeat protein
MSDDKRKLAADCWRKGNDAAAKENWDYAIQMLHQCVRFDPSNLMFRQTLRGLQEKKYGGNKTGARMSGMKLMGIRGKLKKAQLRKEWDAAEKACEEGLMVNPWDPQLNADLGQALKELGHLEVATFAYEKSVAADAKNKDALRELAECYEAKGEYNLASGVWGRIMKLDPTDGEARTRSQQAATKQVIDRGGYEGAENTKGVMADHEVAKRLNIQQDSKADGPGQSEEADLQRAIRKEPDNKDNYTKLGDFYRRSGKLDESRNMYQKAVELSGGDVNIREQVEDVELDMMRKELEIARQKAGEGDETAKANAAQLANELLAREVEVLRTRVERYPNDMRVKFHLAECFMRTQQFSQAIPLFQQASQDSRIETKALSKLGVCFMQEKKYALAKRQFEKAVPKLNANDHPDLFKDTNYRLGRLCEASGDNEAAENYYSEVLAVDYGYKDTLQRLEDLQSS